MACARLIDGDGGVSRPRIEALLTGINARYKNTQDAPNAAEYDALRVLPPGELREKFVAFEQTLADRIDMLADGVEAFVEVGPGKVLSGLVRRIAKGSTALAIDDITTERGLELPA